MGITYTVQKFEDCFAGLALTESHNFNTLEEAIVFHKTKPALQDSWWEIIVSYT